MSLRPLRSALYLPANRASAVEKARSADCDTVILDLEDAVAPEAKVEARAAAVATVRAGRFGDRLLIVRVNALETEWGVDDLAALAGARPDAVLVPKVSSARDLREAHSQMSDEVAIWAMLETCAAFLDLSALAREGSAVGLSTFVLGTNDLALEMRCTLDAERTAMLPLLTQSVVAARAYGLSVLDGVFNDIGDEDGLVRQCRQGAMLGFDGKTVIHPRQLDAANRAFGPSDEQVAQARAIADAFAARENAKKGVIRLDGRMVELLHLREAERVLAMREALDRR